MQIPTIKIENKNTKRGWSIINESDFDKAKHKSFKEKPAAKEKPVD